LGEHYPGYYPVKDEAALARLMRKAETEPEFLAQLAACVNELAETFTPERERQSLEQAVALALAAVNPAG
jgi:hypothetical protein